MKTIFFKEIRINLKNFLIWSLGVGLLGLSCILLYKSMQGDMKEMADAFSNMGAFSDAFGMSTLSIATLEGYFATEVGTVHGLGSAMFAAIIAIGILSKEEEEHTGEFLFSFPVSRVKVVIAKFLCIITMLVMFTLICAGLYAYGFYALDVDLPTKEFWTFMLRELLMNVEIAAVCFFLSSISSKNKMGTGLGIALLLYVYDLIGRVVPDLKDYLFIGPFSYANASEIFSNKNLDAISFVLAAAVILLCSVSAIVTFNKRDLAG